MDKNEIEAAFNICVAICGQDGIVSSQEEDAIIQNFKSIYNLSDSTLSTLFENFFESKIHIDEYLGQITDAAKQQQILRISELSAAIDDLDIRENIALQRAKLVWGIA